MLFLICNPAAGNGRAVKICENVKRVLTDRKINFHCECTTKPGHATALAAVAAQKGAKSVLAIGGDGTAYEVACGLLGTKTALGIIPAGTGNDFIKALGYPLDAEKALEHVLCHDAKPTDVGQMDGRIFLNEIGTGFDVTVLEYANKAKKYCRGLLPYLYGVICTMLCSKPIRLTYQIDDEAPVTKDVLVCGVANGSVIGGGIVIAPQARVDDGLFDVIVIDYIPRHRLPPYLFKLLTGKVLSFPETTFLRAKKVTFSTPDMHVNIDGEIKAMDSVSVSIAPNSLLIHR